MSGSDFRLRAKYFLHFCKYFQCWDADTGAVNTATISFWLRTLLQQNSDLVEVNI